MIMQLGEGQEIEESIHDNIDLLIQGNWQKIIRSHFSLVKSCNIEVAELNEIARLCKAFTEEDFKFINGLPANFLKMGIFWKRLLRKGEDSCYLIVKELTKNSHCNLIKIITSDNVTCNGNTCHMNQEFTKEILQQNAIYIGDELNLTRGVQDMLFEYDIISIDDHDVIDNQPRRTEKRTMLVELLLRKENTDWIPGFIQIMYITGHTHVLEYIRSQLNMEEESMLRPVRIGNTKLSLGSTAVVPTQTYLLSLQSQAQGIGNFGEVIDANERIQNVLQETINTDVLEIREGSIYFHLHTFSTDILLSILNGRADDKIKLCLNSLFQSSSLVRYFGKDTVIEFMLKEIPEDTFITDGKKTQHHGKKMVKALCTACYQTTLRQNRETIIGEIEDDIIEDTMNEVKELRRDTMLKSTECFLGYKSRRQKAIAFLQYVLCNEDVLFAFEKAFSFRSQVRIDTIKCRKCEEGNGANLKIHKLRTRKCYFTVSLDEIGSVCINDVTKTVSLPSHVFWNVSDQPNIQRKLIRTMTMNEFTPFKAFEEYRLIVMDETTEPDKISFLDATKLCRGNILHFYKLPRIKNNTNNEEGDKKTIARCVALTSPGPHAFVLITNVLKLKDLESTLRPYREYCGSNILKYLAVMFVKDEQFRFAPEEYIESSLQLHRLLEDGSRCIIFDNMASEDRKYVQIQKFVRMIEGMFRQNQGQYFSNPIFEELENAIQIVTQKKEKEKRLTIRRCEDEKQKTIKLLEDQINQLRIEVDRIEDEKLKKIRQFDDKSKQLKQKNSRSEAAEQVWSQNLIDEILSA